MVKGVEGKGLVCYIFSAVGYILVVIGLIFIVLGFYGDGMNALASTIFSSLISAIFIISLVFFHLSDRWCD